MPAVVRGRMPPMRRIAVPERMALALSPELDRGAIPSRVTMSTDVPFAGELREEQSSARPLTIGPNATITLATLRRPWVYVGWAVNPGNIGGAGLSAFLRILTRGVNGATTPVALAGTAPFAVLGITCGARAELVLVNATGNPVAGVRGSIWGMGAC